jgi:hypothetical protein
LRRKANGRNGFAKNRYFSFNRNEMGIMYVVMGIKAGVWNGKAVSVVICLGGQNGTGNDRSGRKEVRRNGKGKGSSGRIGAAVYLTAESGCLFLLVERRRGQNEKCKMEADDCPYTGGGYLYDELRIVCCGI